MGTVEIQPVPVEVINHPIPKRYECRSSFRSIVLTAANPYQQVAGFDPLRERIKLSGVANAVVVGNSISQASDPNNVANPYVAPNGRFIPGGAALAAIEWTIEGTQEVWLSGNTYPTIVGIEIIRKVPE
jgi:hypothetical protein